MAQKSILRGKRAFGRRSWLRTALLGAASVASGQPLLAHSSAADPPRKLFDKRLSELKSWTEKHGGQLSADILDLDSGKSLGGVSSNSALNPASNMKVVTAAVALDLLGPQMQFRTGLYGSPKAGTLPQLILRGHGDPSLSEASLWRLGNVIASMGFSRVGSLLVDQSAFDEQFVPPAFEQQPEEWAPFRAPVSAIAVDRNSVTCNIRPTTSGKAARVWFQPGGAVEMRGSVMTVDKGRGQSIKLRLEPGTTGLLAHLDGKIALGLGRQRYRKRVADPRLLPGLVLAAQLRGLGVEVHDVKLGRVEGAPRLTYHGSAPLSELVRELGKHSDNFYAEMLFKSLATTTSQAPASSSAAAAVVTDWLAKLLAPPPGQHIVNGSGLFDASRLSAKTLVRVLQHAYDTPRLRSEFVSHLAIGGVDGTLISRFRAHRKSRAIRAKTGTLNRAIALSGYAFCPNRHKPVAFSFLVNGIAGKHQAIRTRIDKTVDALFAI